MNLMQLTFIVAVNMMGSGIIMLPTNMAQVGAISLLSWIVTAVGSMAIAYGFAQAGLFNQRPGGMSAYAEDAYGKPGYFLVFFLYFLSLAIGNVAIGDLGAGLPAGVLPVALVYADRDLHRHHRPALADHGREFRRPEPDRAHRRRSRSGASSSRSGFISIIGWFWFSGETFAAAWNPNGLSLAGRHGLEHRADPVGLPRHGVGGAELGCRGEPEARRARSPACSAPSGAAVIYILSTTVIQGIVPNAELAKSTGPFGARLSRKMFNPYIGSIIMALAVMACLGSLLGWQFTHRPDRQRRPPTIACSRRSSPR